MVHDNWEPIYYPKDMVVRSIVSIKEDEKVKVKRKPTERRISKRVLPRRSMVGSFTKKTLVNPPVLKLGKNNTEAGSIPMNLTLKSNPFIESVKEVRLRKRIKSKSSHSSKYNLYNKVRSNALNCLTRSEIQRLSKYVFIFTK